jgi:hypothetical protein
MVLQDNIKNVADAIVNGRMGIIEGVRILVQNQERLQLPQQDLLTFIGIESETDYIPVGEIRNEWSNAVLK